MMYIKLYIYIYMFSVMICDICMMLFVVCLQEAVSRAIKDLMPCICE